MTDPDCVDPAGWDEDGSWAPIDWREIDADTLTLVREDAMVAYDERVAETLGYFEAQFCTDDEVVLGLPAQVSVGDLQVLDLIDPATLQDPLAKLAYIQRLDAVTAMVAAKRLDAVIALAGVVRKDSWTDEVHLEEELACARHTSTAAAGSEIERARALRQMFHGFHTALLAGEISPAHVSVLVEKCRVVEDADILSAIEALVLAKAKRLPPGKFGTQVARAIAKLDPDAASRRTKARTTRSVWFRTAEDGMATLTVLAPTDLLRAAFDRITTDGRALQLTRGRASAAKDDDDATADACRTDAFLARILGQTHPDGSVSFDPTQAEITLDVVMTEASLSAGANGLALINGEPVPATIARDYARFAKAWRRALTDPVTGHLIDHGRKVYLPADLRAYLLARDGGCVGPTCNVTHRSKVEMEHGIPFPDGPSNTTNCRIWCSTEHKLKTAGYLDITDLRPDGSATWVTAFGQRIHIPARPFLDAPAPPPSSSPPTAATTTDDARPDAGGRPEPPELDEPPF